MTVYRKDRKAIWVLFDVRDPHQSHRLGLLRTSWCGYSDVLYLSSCRTLLRLFPGGASKLMQS